MKDSYEISHNLNQASCVCWCLTASDRFWIVFPFFYHITDEHYVRIETYCFCSSLALFWKIMSSSCEFVKPSESFKQRLVLLSHWCTSGDPPPEEVNGRGSTSSHTHTQTGLTVTLKFLPQRQPCTYLTVQSSRCFSFSVKEQELISLHLSALYCWDYNTSY